jgi:Outer membrane protein and related peptidoglycan-associated (lipo)proteins
MRAKRDFLLLAFFNYDRYQLTFMIQRIFFICSILFIEVGYSDAQVVVPSTGVYQDSLGRMFIQANAPAYFFVDTTGGRKELIPGEAKFTNPMFFDGPGTHFFVYRNPATGEKVRFKIVADAKGPKSELKYTKGLSVKYKNTFYCEKDARAEVVAKDDKSGVYATYFSTDKIHFAPANTILFDKVGEQKVYMFAVDNVGNIGDTLVADVLIDFEATINMRDIFFDYNSARIRPDSHGELQSLIEMMNEHPVIRIEISAFTDSRGSSEYNLKLSQKRAIAVLNYFVLKGIAASRLKAIGMGEKNPVNRCIKGVKCTEEEHQANRRVEFKLLPLK